MTDDGERTCQSCGAPITPHAAFCGSCGTAVDHANEDAEEGPPEGEASGWDSIQQSVDRIGEDTPPTAEDDDDATVELEHDNEPAAHAGAASEQKGSPANYLWAVLGIIGGLIGYATLQAKDPKLGKRVLIAGACVTGVGLLLVVVQLVFLGSLFKSVTDDMGASAYDSSPTYDSYDSYSTPTPTPTPTPSGIDASTFTATNTWNWTSTQDGGYTETVTFEVGAPLKLSTSPYYYNNYDTGAVTLEAGDYCSVDSVRDAVVPYRLTVANSTTGFDAQVGANLTMTLDVESLYSDGGECQSAGDAFGVQSVEALSPGEDIVNRGFIILSDYYTPAAPTGDPAVISEELVTVNSSTDDNSRVWALAKPGVSGPGVRTASYGIPNQFYLSGVVASN